MSEAATLEKTNTQIAEGDVIEKDVSTEESGDTVKENTKDIVETDTVTATQLTAAKESKLADILKREKSSETTGEPLNLTDEELDIYEEYVDGNLKPGESKEVDEDETDEKSEDDSTPETSKELKELMELSGAKDDKQLLKKYKDAVNHIANKSSDAKFVSEISNENTKMKKLIENEASMYEGIGKGDANALKYMEDNHGLVPKTQQKSKTSSNDDDGGSDDFIDPAGFLDDETATKVNGKFKAQAKENQALKDSVKKLTDTVKNLVKDRQSETDSVARSKADNDLLTNTLSMAMEFEGLKELPNLSDHIDKFLKGTNTDELFTGTIGKVFDEWDAAKERGESITLKTAFKLLKAENADLLISEAKSKGKKDAYNEHQSSKNLSEKQKGGQSSMYRNFSDSDIEKMEQDTSLIPDEFFDDVTGEPIPKDKMPKKLWKLMGY